MATQKFELLHVTWTDAHSHDPWTDREDSEINETMEVHTVGVKLKETDDALVLAATFSCEDTQVAGVWTIPKKMIVGCKKVKVIRCAAARA